MPLRRVSLSRLESFDEYDLHAQVFELEEESVGLKGFIAIHRQKENIPALGATRFWEYKNEDHALRDALRLSRLMSCKAAMAGLSYTGGKAVLLKREFSTITERQDFFSVYADLIQQLGGQFVTGTDVGVSNEDILVMKKITPFVIGESVDSGYYTAHSVLTSIHTAISFLNHDDTLRGQTAVVQGLGKTGGHLVDMLCAEGVDLGICDIDTSRVDFFLKKYPQNIRNISLDNVFSQKAFLFAPCALNGVLNRDTITQMNYSVIVGSANNQLADRHCGKLLYEHNILYAPDYIVNAGGLISVVDAYLHGQLNHGRVLNAIAHIQPTLLEIFERSKNEKRPIDEVADDMVSSMV